ncbi:helix-turn-helix domain-containing protein [Lactobacillus sp.]|uniref:helix-turn-helix domain-containing protein n=1 Tax=Lactobacillus sp. TaxID=1591 RepID=UPI002590ED79|nr:helix-turn-helix domain-containing protein [Lactobacillus sp.]MCO6530417.1 helix-turn-helix domain-containing protein [Lactobacillus sp.]
MIEYFTYKEAMKYLGINSYQGLRNLFSEGLPIIQVGKTKKISKNAIDEFMKEHQKAINE